MINLKNEKGEEVGCYLHLPKCCNAVVQVYAKAVQLWTANKKVELGQHILLNCWLGGDERLKAAGNGSDWLHVNAAMEASNFVTFLQGNTEDI